MKTPGKKNQKGHEEWKRALKFVYIDKETWVGLIDISGVFFFFSPQAHHAGNNTGCLLDHISGTREEIKIPIRHP